MEQRDRLIFNVKARRRLHEEIGELSIIGREERCALLTISIQDPPGEEQSRSLVPLSESLGPGHPKGDDRCGLDRIVDGFDGRDRPLNKVEVVWLLEPFFRLANGAVDGEGETQRRPPQ